VEVPEWSLVSFNGGVGVPVSSAFHDSCGIMEELRDGLSKSGEGLGENMGEAGSRALFLFLDSNGREWNEESDEGGLENSSICRLRSFILFLNCVIGDSFSDEAGDGVLDSGAIGV
jgi:hypothetical protein